MANRTHFRHIRHAFIADGSGFREVVLPPHIGKKYIDTYVVRMVAENPEVTCGYIEYDSKEGAFIRMRGLYAATRLDDDSHGAAICQRGNVVYVIKAADAHA